MRRAKSQNYKLLLEQATLAIRLEGDAYKKQVPCRNSP